MMTEKQLMWIIGALVKRLGGEVLLDKRTEMPDLQALFIGMSEGKIVLATRDANAPRPDTIGGMEIRDRELDNIEDFNH